MGLLTQWDQPFAFVEMPGAGVPRGGEQGEAAWHRRLGMIQQCLTDPAAEMSGSKKQLGQDTSDRDALIIDWNAER